MSKYELTNFTVELFDDTKFKNVYDLKVEFVYEKNIE